MKKVIGFSSLIIIAIALVTIVGINASSFKGRPAEAISSSATLVVSDFHDGGGTGSAIEERVKIIAVANQVRDNWAGAATTLDAQEAVLAKVKTDTQKLRISDQSDLNHVKYIWLSGHVVGAEIHYEIHHNQAFK